MREYEKAILRLDFSRIPVTEYREVIRPGMEVEADLRISPDGYERITGVLGPRCRYILHNDERPVRYYVSHFQRRGYIHATHIGEATNVVVKLRIPVSKKSCPCHKCRYANYCLGGCSAERT